MRLLLPSLLISSCAAAPVQRGFDAPSSRVREAVLASLARHDDVQEEDGVVTTGWGPETDAGSQGLLLGYDYKVRVRHRVEIRGAIVAVTSFVERRAPGGVRANRWERVDGRGRPEAALLDAIAARLK